LQQFEHKVIRENMDIFECILFDGHRMAICFTELERKEKNNNFILTQHIMNGKSCKMTTETSEKQKLFSNLFCYTELECNLIYCELVSLVTEINSLD